MKLKTIIPLLTALTLGSMSCDYGKTSQVKEERIVCDGTYDLGELESTCQKIVQEPFDVELGTEVSCYGIFVDVARAIENYVGYVNRVTAKGPLEKADLTEFDLRNEVEFNLNVMDKHFLPGVKLAEYQTAKERLGDDYFSRFVCE